MGRGPGRPWQIHVVAADGGPVEVLEPENVADPGWTSDGKALYFGGMSGSTSPILLLDLDSRRQTIVPGSHGLFSPRPSPDGRYLAALRADSWTLMILDLRTGHWSALTTGPVAYPAWTRDGSWLHFHDLGASASFRRIELATRREESVAAVGGLALADGEWGAWSGLSPDGAPLLLHAPTGG